MIIRRIKKWEENDGLYSVWYEGFGEQRADMKETQFNLAQGIDGLLRRAIDPKDIERLVDLAVSYGFECASED